MTKVIPMDDDDQFEWMLRRAWAVMPEDAREDLRCLGEIIGPIYMDALKKQLAQPTLLSRILKDHDGTQTPD